MALSHSRSSSSSHSSHSSCSHSARLLQRSVGHETVASVSETQYDDDFDCDEAETEDDALRRETLRERKDAADAYDDDVFEHDDDAEDDGDAAAKATDGDGSSIEDTYSADSFETLDASTREAPAVARGGESADARESCDESAPPKTSRDSASSTRDEVEVEHAREHSPVPESAATRGALASRWCARKIRTLGSLSASGNEAKASPSSALDHRVPLHALAALRTRLARRSPPSASSAADTDARPSPRSRARAERIAARASVVPRAAVSRLVDRARTARLLLTTTLEHLVADESDDEWQTTTEAAATAMPPPMSTRLETFCAAKRALLERKVATLRFADRYARTCAGDASGMSVETLELVSAMVAAQRQSAMAPSCFQARTAQLDATVATTKRRLRESRSLRARAAQLLQTRDVDAAPAP